MKPRGRGATPKAQSIGDRKPPNKHQPSKADMEEVIVIDATLDQLAGAVLAGGAPRREPVEGKEDRPSATFSR